MPRCGDCGHPLAGWHPGAVCPECGSGVRPWRPTKKKALNGHNRLLAFAWPFALELVVALGAMVLNWLFQDAELKAGVSALQGVVFAYLAIGALVNTGVVTFFLIRHAQRKRWAPVAAEHRRAILASLIAMTAAAIGGVLFVWLGVALGGFGPGY